MTEEILQNQNMQPEMAQPAPVAPAAPAMQEKMLPQSEVNALVGKVKADAYEKARREVMGGQGGMGQPNPQAAQLMAQGGLSEDQVRSMMRDEAQRINAEQAQMLEAQRIVGEFATKMDTGKEAYADFEDTVRQVNLRTIPEIVQLANSVPNTPDIMYYISKNPYKIAQFKQLAALDADARRQGFQSNLAMQEMMRLSNSISNNKQAVTQVQTKEPLGQMKPSTGTVDSSAPMTLADMKRQKWAKG